MRASKSENPAAGNAPDAADAYPSYRRLAAQLKTLPWRTAAPSWVVPGTAVDSCRFLEGLVDEVALAFFETDACLAYTEADLPRAGQFDLDFHIHLPMDLPWRDGPRRVADACLALAAKAAHLAPRSFVLHPPQEPADLEGFVKAFRAGHPGRVLLENIEGRGVDDLPGLARDLDLGLCLDLGHLLAYKQQSLVEALLKDSGVFEEQRGIARQLGWELVDMLHLNAPGPGGRHMALTTLTVEGQDRLETLLAHLRPGAVVNLELFEAGALLDSARTLCDAAARLGLAPHTPPTPTDTA